MKDRTPDINLDAEVKALADYISLKWTPIANIEQMFRDIRDAALDAARAWVDHYAISEAAHELQKARVGALEPTLASAAERRLAEYHDAGAHFFFEASMAASRIARAGQNIDGQWDYSRRVDRICATLRTRYPGLAGALPLGWDELAKDYCDFDGQEEYEPWHDEALFQGTRIESAGAGNFVNRTALPYVMYDEKCQDRKAYAVLVGAVFAHFLGIKEYLNAQGVTQALRSLLLQMPPNITFDWQPVDPQDPFVRVLAATLRPGPTQAEYLDGLERQKAWDALSEEERQARSAANKLDVSEMLREFNSPEWEQKQRDEEAALVAAMKKVFG